MELFKSTQYYFNPSSVWSLTNCYLPEEVEDQNYADLIIRSNYSLSTEEQQYYWFKACFENLRDKIVSKGFCVVHFDVYLRPSNLPPLPEDKFLVLNSNGYSLFVNTFDNRSYNSLQEYHSMIGEITKFHYTWWLYCLSGEEKKRFLFEEKINHKNCVLEITITDN